MCTSVGYFYHRSSSLLRSIECGRVGFLTLHFRPQRPCHMRGHKGTSAALPGQPHPNHPRVTCQNRTGTKDPRDPALIYILRQVKMSLVPLLLNGASNVWDKPPRLRGCEALEHVRQQYSNCKTFELWWRGSAVRCTALAKDSSLGLSTHIW